MGKARDTRETLGLPSNGYCTHLYSIVLAPRRAYMASWWLVNKNCSYDTSATSLSANT